MGILRKLFFRRGNSLGKEQIEALDKIAGAVMPDMSSTPPIRAEDIAAGSVSAQKIVAYDVDAGRF